MSIAAVSWVLEESKSEGYDRLVLLAIADHASSRGDNAFVSIRTIARQARVSPRKVQYSIRKLEQELGELGVEYGAGIKGTNRYRLVKMRPLPLFEKEKKDNPSTSGDLPGEKS